MSEPDAPAPSEGRAAGVRRWWWLLAVAFVGALFWWSPDCGGGSGTGETDDAGVDTDGTDGEGPAGPVAHIEGKVWLEVQPVPEPEAPAEPAPEDRVATVVVDGDTAHVVDDTTTTGDAPQLGTTTTGGDTGGDTGGGIEAAGSDDEGGDPFAEDAQAAEESFTPPDYELVPAEAGSCRILAWQSGVKVGGPATCDGEGAFEVALDPGVSGRTAFEILVPGRLRAVVEVDVPEGGRGRLPDVALGVAQTVSGQVVDRDGTPIADASIEAMPFSNLSEPEPWRASTDADGNFTIDTLPPGPLGMRARADGYAVSVAEAIAPSDDVWIVLDRLHELRGRVVGPPEILARTRVRLEGSGVWPARQVEVDAQGKFAFADVPDGVYALEAVAPAGDGKPGYASIPLENVTPELEATLGLIAAYDVAVQVLDPTGQPAADARVTLANASIGVLQRFATTDAQGRAKIGPVVPGPYVLRADAEGYLPATPLSLSIEDADPPESILHLAAPGRIEGRVVDEDGRPVPDARVAVVAEELHTVGESSARAQVFAAAASGPGSLGVTTGPVPPIPGIGEDDAADGVAEPFTDADGRFTVPLLPPGRYTLQARHVDFAHGTEASVDVGPGAVVAGIELVLRRGERLTGRVRDGNGRPIDGARVEIDGDVVLTDRKGEFDAGPRRGRVRIVARAWGKAPTIETVTVRDRPVDVELVLEDARGQLTGRVEGENGEVLADARVTLRMLDGLTPTEVVWTDARGVYRFDSLPTGPAEIVIDHPDHGEATQAVRVDEGDSPVDVALAKGWSIDVEVLAEGTREPIAGARVVAGSHRGITDEHGRATIEHVVDPRVTVQVDAEGWGAAQARVVRPASDLAEVRLVVREGGGLAGRVTDYRGDPVGDALVVVRDADGHEVARTRTDAAGTWSVSSVDAGDVEVEALPPVGRDDELAPAALASDVLRGHVTRGVDLRFDRQ